MWLDKLKSANCKAKLQFRAGQTSLNLTSYLQQNIFNQQRCRADTILIPHLRKASARCTQAMQKSFTQIILLIFFAPQANSQSNIHFGTYTSTEYKKMKLVLNSNMTFKYNIGLLENSWKEGQFILKGDTIILNYYQDTTYKSQSSSEKSDELFTSGPSFKKPVKFILKKRKLYNIDEKEIRLRGYFIKSKSDT